MPKTRSFRKIPDEFTRAKPTSICTRAPFGIRHLMQTLVSYWKGATALFHSTFHLFRLRRHCRIMFLIGTRYVGSPDCCYTWSPWQYNTAQVRAMTNLMNFLVTCFGLVVLKESIGLSIPWLMAPLSFPQKPTFAPWGFITSMMPD